MSVVSNQPAPDLKISVEAAVFLARKCVGIVARQYPVTMHCTALHIVYNFHYVVCLDVTYMMSIGVV